LLADNAPHAAAWLEPGFAQVKMQQAIEEVPILLIPREVEAIMLIENGRLRRRPFAPKNTIHRVRRSKVAKEKRDDACPKEDKDQARDALDQERQSQTHAGKDEERDEEQD